MEKTSYYFDYSLCVESCIGQKLAASTCTSGVAKRNRVSEEFAPVRGAYQFGVTLARQGYSSFEFDTSGVSEILPREVSSSSPGGASSR